MATGVRALLSRPSAAQQLAADAPGSTQHSANRLQDIVGLHRAHYSS